MKRQRRSFVPVDKMMNVWRKQKWPETSPVQTVWKHCNMLSLVRWKNGLKCKHSQNKFGQNHYFQWWRWGGYVFTEGTWELNPWPQCLLPHPMINIRTNIAFNSCCAKRRFQWKHACFRNRIVIISVIVNSVQINSPEKSFVLGKIVVQNEDLSIVPVFVFAGAYKTNQRIVTWGVALNFLKTCVLWIQMINILF